MQSVKVWMGDQVYALRLSLRLTQTEFAARVGVHYVTISLWERNIKHPSMANMRVLDAVEHLGDVANRLSDVQHGEAP